MNIGLRNRNDYACVLLLRTGVLPLVLIDKAQESSFNRQSKMLWHRVVDIIWGYRFAAAAPRAKVSSSTEHER